MVKSQLLLSSLAAPDECIFLVACSHPPPPRRCAAPILIPIFIPLTLTSCCTRASPENLIPCIFSHPLSRRVLCPGSKRVTLLLTPSARNSCLQHPSATRSTGKLTSSLTYRHYSSIHFFPRLPSTPPAPHPNTTLSRDEGVGGGRPQERAV